MSSQRLGGKVAVVTGGAYGFGAAIVQSFAAEGATVVVADIDEEQGARVVAELGLPKEHFIRTDVSRMNEVANLSADCVKRHGVVDILVNAANYTHANQPMLNIPEALFDRIFAVNCKSLFNTATAFVPVFRHAGRGVIINVASTGGCRPRSGLTWYNGSKGAVIALTKSMALELASENVRVNAINPALAETEHLSALMGLPDTPGNRAKFLATIPLGRLAAAADIANAAVYLASDEASFITGTCLNVDGGRSI